MGAKLLKEAAKFEAIGAPQGPYLMTVEDALRRYIRTHRRSPLMQLAGRAAERFLNAWFNVGFYEFSENGEAFVLQCLAEWAGGRQLRLWDVGAHKGGYALEAHKILPNAEITSFEIIPVLADRLATKSAEASWLRVLPVGLSDRVGVVPVAFNGRYDTTSSINPFLAGDLFAHDEVQFIEGHITTVDKLISSGTPAPDMIKIDVEGHEAAVIDGAQVLLTSDHAPALVQFEYGATWIAASRTLYNVQAKLEAAGYSVGRLFPRHVEFKGYEVADETFRMGNMVATRVPELKRLLES
jgi:FkbM family methyltransferase